MSERIQNILLVVVVILIALFVLDIPFCCASVGKGDVGVVSTFGNVSDEPLQPGMHFVMPWKAVYRMTTQTQKDEEPAKVPTSNGLAVEMKATLIYHLRPESAPALAKEVGHIGYQDKVVSPYFRNAVRDVTAEFLPEALYTAERAKVEARIKDRVSKELEKHGFEVEAVMLLDPVLPQVVQDRIQAKVAAEQDAIRMESVYKQKELEGKTNKRVKELDAEAKVIEAKGIADAQAIIKKDLDHNYLVYLWIEALKESAKHNNATIYIPTGTDGMPYFANVGKSPVTTTLQK
jgi:prohibitin 1